MDFLNLGTIINTHGLDGTLVIASNTYFGELRYQKGATLYLLNPHNKEEIIKVEVESYRRYKETDYVKFKNIDDKDTAIKYKGYTVEINKEDAILPKGFYHFSDLVGCVINDENGNKLGNVIKVEEFPAQITLRVQKDDKKTFFVPFIQDVFILHVDIKNKVITIKYMEGMF